MKKINLKSFFISRLFFNFTFVASTTKNVSISIFNKSLQFQKIGKTEVYNMETEFDIKITRCTCKALY